MQYKSISIKLVESIQIYEINLLFIASGKRWSAEVVDGEATSHRSVVHVIERSALGFTHRLEHITINLFAYLNLKFSNTFLRNKFSNVSWVIFSQSMVADIENGTL